MAKHQFQIDGRAAAPARREWAEAAFDAVQAGCAVWSGHMRVKLNDALGATIERIEDSRHDH